jgi:hypothetical protein
VKQQRVQKFKSETQPGAKYLDAPVMLPVKYVPVPPVKKLTIREKSILSGLYLSKFDTEALLSLGFDSFLEAFNVIGAALGVKSASIKNYRDEFDPLFPNARKGWHKRKTREYCKAVFDAFGSLQLDQFTALIKQLIYREGELDLLMEAAQKDAGDSASFAKRLITGQAAEEYFKSHYRSIELFHDLKMEDVTKRGCGFDFKLLSANIFYAVEVKGLSDTSGSIAFTDKEHTIAALMKDTFFLFVVKNFRETPYHELYQNPLDGKLHFSRIERPVIQITWGASL